MDTYSQYTLLKNKLIKGFHENEDDRKDVYYWIRDLVEKLEMVQEPNDSACKHDTSQPCQKCCDHTEFDDSQSCVECGYCYYR